MSRHRQSEIDQITTELNDSVSAENVEPGAMTFLCESNETSQSKADDEIVLHKGAGQGTLVMRGKASGSMVGYIKRIPNVDLNTMKSDPEQGSFHAYGIFKRKGSGGIAHHVQKRLGEYQTHDDALAAVKKFNKIK